MDEFADAVHARFDTVDLLINNAGIGVGAGFFDTTREDWDRLIAVNIMGLVHGCERFIPRMIERGTGGQVANVSSGCGYSALPYMFGYSVTKFAAFGFSEALRMEMRRHKIGVTTICPGLINTPILRTSVTRGARAAERPSGSRACMSGAATHQRKSRSTSCARWAATARSPRSPPKPTSPTRSRASPRPWHAGFPPAPQPSWPSSTMTHIAPPSPARRAASATHAGDTASTMSAC